MLAALLVRGRSRAFVAEQRERIVGGKWHALDGEPQTDELFEREIVRRMGEAFYRTRTVFAPTVSEARADGRSHESIRDSIRKDWKPA